MSSDTLTWLLTKNTSSFLVKRNGNEFAREKFNLLNRNCRKYSGLASSKAVDISLADKKVTLTTKIAKATKKPAKAENAVPLRKGARGGANTIRANISRNYYRRDLKKAALAKWSRLSTVAKVEKGVLQKKAIRSRRVKAVAWICRSYDRWRSTKYRVRSSKTLIGSGTTTCDVVISGENVLNSMHCSTCLQTRRRPSWFRSQRQLVSARERWCSASRRSCVVHGDRVAFGTPRNVFVFELTPHPQMKALRSSRLKRRSPAFRKALDTLRGDRRTSTLNASVAASIQNNLQTARTRSSVTSYADSTAPSLKSKSQLSKFLLEASTDSLLSDYVERKLSQRRSRQFSIESSNQSESTRRNRATSGVQQSREQRNLAEVEKLRLSQRIREVNDVLNGDLEFQESYLSPSAKSSRSRKPRWTLNNTPSDRLQSGGDARSDEDSEEDEEDELPDMMEKVAIHSKSPPVYLSASIQTEHSDQENNSNPPSREEIGEESEQLDYSLESMPVSEATQSLQQPGSPSQSYNPPKARNFLSKAMELGFNDLTRSHSRPINTARQEAAKTALQEKLINQTIRRKKNEIMSEAFVRWIRGLRIQSQNREHKARQLEEIRAALGNLRRDQYFIRWRDFAALSSQVVICRLEAFQQRCDCRLVQKCWVSLRLSFLSTRQRSTLLRGLVLKKAVMGRHRAFRLWHQFVQKCSTRNQLGDVQRVERLKLDAHLERMSERHYNNRTLQPRLTQILRKWRMAADRHKKQRQKLRRVLVHGTSKLTRRALRKWNEAAMISRYSMGMKMQTEQQIQQTTDRLTSQHDQTLASLRESHAHQLQKLMVAIEEKDRELAQLKRQQRAETLEKGVAKRKCEQELRKFFECAIGKCDEQIAQAGDQLEKLLQSAEGDVLGARFGAAQVDGLAGNQKIQNANESTRLQEAVQACIKHPTALENPAHDPVSDLSSNVRFLYDMIQQVYNLSISFPALHSISHAPFLCFPAPHTSSAASPFVSETCSGFRCVWHLSRPRPPAPQYLPSWRIVPAPADPSFDHRGAVPPTWTLGPRNPAEAALESAPHAAAPPAHCRRPWPPSARGGRPPPRRAAASRS
ncbi:Ribosomal L28e/Mak16 [Phytophthora cactorum]|nr:Ribosomal L28e/Mak16 [Phytophthora cactorum]